MRRIVVLILGLTVAASAMAANKRDLDKRILKLTQKFVTLQSGSDKRVPAETLKEAQGIAILDRTKAGFIFAYQGGSGVAMVRNEKTGTWGPPAFLRANQASLGFLVGGQQSFVVILFMSRDAARILTSPSIDFGGEAGGTAGDASGKAEGTVSNQERVVLVYDSHQGLYGGAEIKGGAVSPDEGANMIYYDQAITMQEILFDQTVKPTKRAVELAEKIEQYTKE